MSWNNIPQELRSLPQWCLWRLEERTNKHGKVNKTKVPYSAKDLRLTGSTADHAKEWTDFNAAWAALEANEDQFNGLMFNFTDTPYFGIDFDHKAQDGLITDPEVQGWVQKFATYSEFSQSGHGVHLIGKAILDVLKQRGLKRDDIGVEIYATGRCFVMTGNQIPGTSAILPDCYAITKKFIEVTFAEKFKKDAERKQRQKQKQKEKRKKPAANPTSATSTMPGVPKPVIAALKEAVPNFNSGFLTIAGVSLENALDDAVVTKRGIKFFPSILTQ